MDAQNLRGIVFMTLSMALFAFDDMFIKLASSDVGVGQIMTIQALLGAFYFGIIAFRRGERLSRSAVFSRSIVLRNIGDVASALCFITALSLMPISNASAILQATPLAVAFGAAVFLGEPVGWRRWCAIGVGFAGVMIVIRPGYEGFNNASFLALAAVLGLAVRDLGTRAAPKAVSTEMIAFVASLCILVAAIVFQSVSSPWSWMSLHITAMVLTGSIFGILGYQLIMHALRIGETSLIAPFRYARIVFAIAVGFVVFGERPDPLTYAGSFLIVASGLYTLYREQTVRYRRKRIS